MTLKWYYSVLLIMQTQLYILLWAAYVAYRHRGGVYQAYGGFTAAASSKLTLPLATKVLAESG